MSIDCLLHEASIYSAKKEAMAAIDCDVELRLFTDLVEDASAVTTRYRAVSPTLQRIVNKHARISMEVVRGVLFRRPHRYEGVRRLLAELDDKCDDTAEAIAVEFDGEYQADWESYKQTLSDAQAMPLVRGKAKAAPSDLHVKSSSVVSQMRSSARRYITACVEAGRRMLLALDMTNAFNYTSGKIADAAMASIYDRLSAIPRDLHNSVSFLPSETPLVLRHAPAVVGKNIHLPLLEFMAGVTGFGYEIVWRMPTVRETKILDALSTITGFDWHKHL